MDRSTERCVFGRHILGSETVKTTETQTESFHNTCYLNIIVPLSMIARFSKRLLLVSDYASSNYHHMLTHISCHTIDYAPVGNFE